MVGTRWLIVVLLASASATQAQDATAQISLAQGAPQQVAAAQRVRGALESVLATAALGEFDEAISLPDRIVPAQGEHDNPLVHGLAHKARATIALLQGRREVFAEQLGAMRHWFGRTDNPALIAQCQRLDKDQRARVPTPEGHRPEPDCAWTHRKLRPRASVQSVNISSRARRHNSSAPQRKHRSLI